MPIDPHQKDFEAHGQLHACAASGATSFGRTLRLRSRCQSSACLLGSSRLEKAPPRAQRDKSNSAFPISAPTPITQSVRDFALLLFPAVVLFIAVSLKTGMNEDMHYILPGFPFVFIGVAGFSGI
jgi:hypothetical protein